MQKKRSFKSANNSNLLLKVPKIVQTKLKIAFSYKKVPKKSTHKKVHKKGHKKVPNIVQVLLKVPKKGPKSSFPNTSLK